MDDKLTCLVIQSGAMGDIFIVAPIAKYYSDKGFLIYWPVRDKYFNLVANYLPYVSALYIDDEKYPRLHHDWLRSDTMHLQKLAQKGNYDLVIDTSDRDQKPNQQSWEGFEQYKYRIANVPFHYKNHLSWKANKEKENDLIAIIEETHNINILKDQYITCHLLSSHNDKAFLPKDEVRYCVEITEIPGFEIPDWYPIIANSKALYAVESAVHQFIDGCIHRLRYHNKDIELYLLSRSSLAPGESYTISQYWDKKFML
jgi:hypothetical protein